MKRERRIFAGILCGTVASGMAQVHAAAPLSIAWFGAAIVVQSAAIAIEGAAVVPIEPAGSEGPVADAGGPYRWTVGQPVRFDGTASNTTADRALRFFWDFGDGTSGHGAVVLHTYAAAGVFTARLTVTDTEEATASAATSVTIAGVAPTSKVIWESVVNAVAEGNQLRKTGWIAGPDAGAVSRQALLGYDGYIEFQAKETDTDRICGLAEDDTGTGPEDVEFGIRLQADGSAFIQESGVGRSVPVRYTTGDRLRVWIESGILRYVHQGRVLGATAFLARTGIVAPPRPEPDLGWQIAATGDFDGDQDTDIVWRHPAEGGNRIWLMDGTAMVEVVDLPDEPDPAWTIAAAADFDDDGGPDLLWRRSTGEVRVWLLDGSTVTGEVALEAEPDLDWMLAGGGDLDGDGDADIVWRQRSQGRNRVWRMDGTTRVETVELDVEKDPAWELVGVARFGVDPHPDLLWRHATTREGRVWLMDGLERQASAPLGAAAGLTADWRIDGAGDFNGDGQADVLRRNQRDGGLDVWLIDGRGPFGLQTDTSLWTPGATVVGAVMSGVANEPPTAETGGPYRWTAGEPIAFDGTGSADPDGDLVRYAWSFGDGNEAEGPTPTHSYAAAGPYTVTLTVTDDDGASATASSNATISTFPQQPAAWSNPVGALSINGNTLAKHGAPGWDTGAGTHQELAGGNGFVELTAAETTTDRAAGFGQDDRRPTLEDIEFGLLLTASGEVQPIESGQPVGDPSPYRAGDRLRVFVDSGVMRYVNNGRVIAVGGGHPTFPLRLDTALFSSGATIAGAMVGGDQIQFRNAPPVVQLQGVGCHVPCHAVFHATATDPDGDTLTYQWGGCVTNGVGGPTATCPLPSVGVVTATVRIADPYGGTSATVSAQATGTNAPPTVAIGGDLACHPPCVANLNAAATDPDGDSLALTWGGCADGQTGVTAACTFADIPSEPVPIDRVVAAMITTTFAVLQTHEAGCTSPAAVDTPNCRAAVHRFCAASAYAGGFGPIEYNPTNAWVVCVNTSFGALPLSNFAELAAYHDGCSGPQAAMSGACGAATNRYCQAHGHGAGFGPVEYTNQVAYPFCARSGGVRVVTTSFAELQQHHGPCTAAGAATAACHVAANRYCQAFGYVGGFGPVEYTADVAQVACLPVHVTTGSADVSVRADDGRGGIGTDAETIALRNARPGVTVLVQPPTCHVPCTVTFTARASDGDGDALSYAWTGCAGGNTGPTATCALPSSGTYSATVTVTDAVGASATASGQAVGTNAPPTVTVSSERSCHPACTARLTATASDPDGDALELRWSGCAAGQVGAEAFCAFAALPDEPPAVVTPGAVMIATTFAVLNDRFDGCTGPVAAPSVVCQAASHRFCVASGYAGGLGPVEYDTVNAQVLCLGRDMAAVNVTSFTALAAQHADCRSLDFAATSACAQAAHRYCIGQGYGSGVGPLEFSGNVAHVLCAEAGIARRVDTTYAALGTYDATCQAGATAQSACRRAVARLCRSRGQGGGFGPVEVNGPTASVTCMPTSTMRVAAPVSVVADDNRGGQATASTAVQVADARPGQLAVTASPSSCPAPCTITFQATAVDPDGDPLVLTWGGCAVGRVGPQATCSATAPSVVRATVDALDGRGGVVSGQAQAEVAASQQNLPPIAHAGGPYRGVATRPVTFDGRASRDPEGRPVTYAWNFGDDGAGTGPTPLHTYAAAGTFTVTLTVTDDRPTSASGSATVTVALLDDPDGDGLPTPVENALGSNPLDPDSNDDGVPDGAAHALGLSLTDGDMDDDGVANAAEIAAGTDPFRADTDGDGAPDGADAFPLDPARQNPQPVPGDHTPPAIQLTKPETATENP